MVTTGTVFSVKVPPSGCSSATVLLDETVLGLHEEMMTETASDVIIKVLKDLFMVADY